MATLPMMPGVQQAAQPAADLSSLMGPMAAAGQQPTAQAGAEEAAKAVMYQIRDLQAGLESFARQYPGTADLMNQAKQLLVKAMVLAVNQSAGTEAPGPAVIG